MAQIVGVHISGYPVGAKVELHGSALPFGVLAQDASIVSQSAYPYLFAKIGSTYNTGGEGAGNFRLPDHRGRSSMGSGTGTGLTARTLGQKVGEESHQLSVSELAAHSHGGNTGGQSANHTHSSNFFQANGNNGGADGGGPGTFGLGQNAGTNTGGFSNDHSHSVGSDGGNSAHNTIHPCLVCTVGIAYI